MERNFQITFYATPSKTINFYRRPAVGDLATSGDEYSAGCHDQAYALADVIPCEEIPHGYSIACVSVGVNGIVVSQLHWNYTWPILLQHEVALHGETKIVVAYRGNRSELWVNDSFVGFGEYGAGTVIPSTKKYVPGSGGTDVKNCEYEGSITGLEIVPLPEPPLPPCVVVEGEPIK